MTNPAKPAHKIRHGDFTVTIWRESGTFLIVSENNQSR
jgi:hypothetical protein